MTGLVVAPPDGRELTIYEADFIEGLALQAAVALENARNHKRNVEFARDGERFALQNRTENAKP